MAKLFNYLLKTLFLSENVTNISVWKWLVVSMVGGTGEGGNGWVVYVGPEN
jgi:hypothetical protein